MIAPPPAREKHGVTLRLKAFYFFYFAAGGALIPFLNLYLARVGLSGTEIGIVSGVFPLVTILAVPLWSAIGDLSRLHTRILYVTLVASVPFVVGISLSRSVGVLLVLVAGYAFFMSPAAPLIDSLSMRCLGSRQERYGGLRVWGAVGWGISAPTVGYLIRELHISVIFYAYAALILIGLTTLIGLPAAETDTYRPSIREFGRLLKSRSWQVFLVCVFLVGVCSNVLEHYFVLFLDDLGGSEWSFGVSVAMASLSEIPVFLLSALLMRRYGARGLLLSALFLYAVRAGVYAGIRNPLIAIPAQLLHGPTFSALWVAGVVYAAGRAPRGLGATAQAAFNTVFMGVGAASGAVLGGVLYDTLGLGPTFLICGGMSLLGFLLLLFLGRAKTDRAPRLAGGPGNAKA